MGRCGFFGLHSRNKVGLDEYPHAGLDPIKPIDGGNSGIHGSGNGCFPVVKT